MKSVLEQIAAIDEQIAEYNSKIKALKETRTGLTAGYEPGAYSEGDFIMEVKPTVRFTASQAEKVLPKKLFDKICAKVPSSELAKKYLTGEQYASCQLETGLSYKVKRVTDV